MARTKAQWRAFLWAYGIARTGDEYAVRVSATLEREKDRVVTVEMTPTEARRLAQALTNNADKVEVLNHDLHSRAQA